MPFNVSPPAPELAPPLLHTATFICECGAQHNSPDARVPAGWTHRAGHVWCIDCTRAGIPVRVLRDVKSSPSGSRRTRLAKAGQTQSGRAA